MQAAMQRNGGSEEVDDGNSVEHHHRQPEVLDGSDITELVNNKVAFSKFVDNKFEQLDRDRDGKLSVQELQPVVSDIGVAIGLPSQGTSADSDHIYTEVLNEFTHGKGHKVSKKEFRHVFTDILLGVADGLKREPVVILKLDGQDLLNFINSSTFEMEMVSIYNHIDLTEGSIKQYITKGLEQLPVDQGMPPISDPWVKCNIVEPALQICSMQDDEQHISEDNFLKEFKKVLQSISRQLKDHPVLVAHTENTFDGSGIKRLLSNKAELEKTLDAVTKKLPKDRHQKLSKKYLLVALDAVAPSAGLPPYGAVQQMDKVVNEVFKMVKAEDGNLVGEVEFNKLMMVILASLMFQLQSEPISVSSNSVVHEPQRFSAPLLT